MKRYYLSKIKKVFDAGLGADVWVHRFQELSDGQNIRYAGGEIAVDPVTGEPTQKALLILVDVKNHAQFANDAEMAVLPEVALDVKAGAMAKQALDQFRAKAQSIGADVLKVGEAITKADAYRDAIDTLGKLNNPAFDSRDFDVE